MAIYEYRCSSCRHKVDIFIQGFSPPAKPKCTRCGSEQLTRIFSRFAVRRAKSDLSVYDDILSDGKLTRGLMSNDPRAIAKCSRKMSHAMDEDPTAESQEIMDRLDAGEDVSELIESIKPPELRGDIGEPE